MSANGTPTPAAVWGIGLVAVVPFVGLALAFGYGPENLRGPALLALMAYATVVLSFLGGARYGEELAGRARPRVMLTSALPALAGWGILLAPSQYTGPGQLGMYIAVFVATWAWNVVSRSTPNWRSPVRTVVAAGAVLSLGLALERALNAGL